MVISITNVNALVSGTRTIRQLSEVRANAEEKEDLGEGRSGSLGSHTKARPLEVK